ncbi:MAG: hypothetical protein ABFS10_12975 [Bacteroidota bacterium]
MKNQIHLLSALLIAIMFFSSCNQVEETGQLKFGLDLTEDATLKSTDQERQVVAALVSIQGADGDIIYDKEYLELIAFGDRFVTRSLKLPVGKFALIEFMLVDAAGEVLWATPKEGSPLAHLVRDPLPQHFGIRTDQTTSLDVQVIRVHDHPPSDFGYAEFNIEFVNHFCLKVLYHFECHDTWRDSAIIDPDGTYPGGGDMPWFEPRLMIHFNDQVLVDQPMHDGLNRYVVPMPYRGYRLSAIDCHGQIFYDRNFSREELLNHRCDPDLKPLVISHQPDSTIIITPEGLYEPTIRQGVFGFIESPLDNNMSEDGSDIWPMKRDIYFFPHYILDSIYTIDGTTSFAPVDCYIPAEMICCEPIAIVRTNSDGYFQVPLEVGEYIYLVKDENRYMMTNMDENYQRPGHVKVYPEEVTKLVIHLVDCSMWM